MEYTEHNITLRDTALRTHSKGHWMRTKQGLGLPHHCGSCLVNMSLALSLHHNRTLLSTGCESGWGRLLWLHKQTHATNFSMGPSWKCPCHHIPTDTTNTFSPLCHLLRMYTHTCCNFLALKHVTRQMAMIQKYNTQQQITIQNTQNLSKYHGIRTHFYIGGDQSAVSGLWGALVDVGKALPKHEKSMYSCLVRCTHIIMSPRATCISQLSHGRVKRWFLML
jgi:hypothetical protein